MYILLVFLFYGGKMREVECSNQKEKNNKKLKTYKEVNHIIRIGNILK